jgi:hypothetical protein
MSLERDTLGFANIVRDLLFGDWEGENKCGRARCYEACSATFI